MALVLWFALVLHVLLLNWYCVRVFLTLSSGYPQVAPPSRIGGHLLGVATRLVLSSPANPVWDMEVLSQPSQIAELHQRAKGLLSSFPATAGPRFFLASVTTTRWIPRVVVVKSGEKIEGILYLKERKVAGISTGILYGDSTLSALLAAAPGQAQAAMEQALRFLLERTSVRGLRIRVLPDGFERSALERVAIRHRAGLICREDPYHLVLPLQHDYGVFLEALGYKTRRNMRYYRRRFEAAGHRFIERMDLPEFRRVAMRLLDQPVVGASREGVVRTLAMLSEVNHPLLCGLRRSDGEWVAIVGGWHDNGLPVVFFQMNNDQTYAADSLCTVLRGYFFEMLIAQGFRRVAFWAGVGGPFARASTPHPGVMVFLDAGPRRWRAIRGVCKMLGPYLPESARLAVNWIAPA
jgi:hypothetical protein